MTESEVELKENITDYVLQNGVENLTSFEIDFIEKLDNLSHAVSLSKRENEIMLEISNKLGA